MHLRFLLARTLSKRIISSRIVPLVFLLLPGIHRLFAPPFFFFYATPTRCSCSTFRVAGNSRCFNTSVRPSFLRSAKWLRFRRKIALFVFRSDCSQMVLQTKRRRNSSFGKIYIFQVSRATNRKFSGDYLERCPFIVDLIVMN